MKKEDILMYLFGIQLLMTLYHVPSTFEYLWNTLNSFGFDTIIAWIRISFSYMFLVIGIIGFYNYTQNQNIFNRQLKIYFIYKIFSFFVYLPNTISFLKRYIEEQSIMPLVFQLINLIIVILVILIFPKEKIYVSEKPVRKQSPRFQHFIIDNLFIIFMSWQFSDTMFYYSFDNYVFAFLLLLFPYFSYLMYYWISESIFQQTIGKVITKKYVRRVDGERASVSKIFGRTLARFIPFEPFSFLSTPLAGWHDGISSTNVFEKSNGLDDGIMEHLISDDDEF